MQGTGSAPLGTANSRNSENKLIQLAHRKQQATILRLVVSAGIGVHLVKIIEKRSNIQNTTAKQESEVTSDSFFAAFSFLYHYATI